MPRIGVLLANIGTPKDPTPKEVAKYLREFLMDERVIDIPKLWRWLLVNVAIVPRRSHTSAAAYQQIWTDDGSPLLWHSEAFCRDLATTLGEDYRVLIGMRYGEPSLSDAVESLLRDQLERIIVVPMFPQHASASTGSTAALVTERLVRETKPPLVDFIEAFYDDPGFIAALAKMHREALDAFEPDRILLSYHGLPERHVLATHNQTECDLVGPCPTVAGDNARCYRAHCYATSRALGRALGLADDQYVTAFQSRLGRTPWIKPYSDEVLPQLSEAGVKRLLVSTPSFVADCLETLEEVGIRMREQWLGLGGEAFHLVPCLNNDPLWVDGFADRLRAAI